MSEPINLMEFSKEAYEQALESGKVILIDFYAEWCGPCKALKPTLKQLAASNENDLVILTYNVDEDEMEFCVKFKVRNIPNLLFLDKEGKKISAMTGNLPLENIQLELNRILDK